MKDKVIVITGASRGLGYAIARQLGAQGAQIVALARTSGGLEELDDAIQKAGGPKAILVPVDLSASHDQLDTLGAQLHQRFGRVDGFIHAAAMLGTLGPITHAEPNEMQRTLNVNAISAYRLLRSLDGLLRAAPAAQVLTVDCHLGDDTVAYWAPYRASKALLRTFTDTYAREVVNTNMTVKSLAPAAMGTKLYRNAFPGIDFATLATIDDEATKLIKHLSS